VDVFVGPNKDSNKVFVIDQVHHRTKEFDEHKCMLGFSTEAQALRAYRQSYGSRSDHRIGDVTEMPIDEFKAWVQRGGGKWPLAPFVGGYILPDDIVKTLGNGDEETGHAITAQMFGEHEALGKSAVHPATVYDLGDGDLATGHKVLQKFIAKVRSSHLEGGHTKLSKAAANYRTGSPDMQCSQCTMFRSPDACTAVKGEISPQALCDYFEPIEQHKE
jgi:Inorganic Pyrophosphatase